MHKTLQKFLLALLLMMGGVLLTMAYHHQLRITQSLALSLSDYKAHLLRAPQQNRDNVVVVAIDEKSIATYGRWPWRRTLLAELFNNLAQAELVGVDIIFAEPSDIESDQALARAIKGAGNVVAGFFFRSSSMVEDAPFQNIEECALAKLDGDMQLEVREYEHLDTNLTMLQMAAASCAAFTIEPDMDGLYREYKLGYVYRGMLFPTMAAQLYQLHSGQFWQVDSTPAGTRFLSGDNRSFPAAINLNFTYEPKHVSAADVLSGAVSPSYFQGKMVLLGATEAGIYDLRPTPFGQTTAGIDVHYTALLNLINGDYFVLEERLTVLLVALVVVLLLPALWQVRAQRRILLYLLAAVVTIVISIMLHKFNHMIYDFYWLLELSLGVLLIEIGSVLWLEKDSRFMKKAFASYVSDELVESIVSDPKQIELGGMEREISVLFSDMRNFTSMSERLRPQELVGLLNRIFEPSTRAILDNRGMLDKYIGDAIMALFNAPLLVPNHADHACQAALEMARAVKRLAVELSSDGKPPISIGIGINTGLAVVGNMGSTVRFSYTAIGDSVNLASRIEGLNKYYGTVVLISEMTKQQLQLPFLLRCVDRIVVKGKSEPIDIYEVLEQGDRNREVATRYEKALGFYFSRQFADALPRFEALMADSDGPSAVMAERCREFIQTPPPAGWRGEYVMTSK